MDGLTTRMIPAGNDARSGDRDTASTTDALVVLDNITKFFGPNPVLRNISLTMFAGQVHALVGQNGAGKSTLGKIIGGVHQPSAGTLTVAGRETTGWSTRDALRSGVATIQQELSLVPDRTVAENVFLGVEHHTMGLLKVDLVQRFDQLEATCHLRLHPQALVRDLRLADQQKVEIMRALARDAQVIVMDEPASSLTADEVGRLHHIVTTLRAEGRLIIYVTHFLDTVLGVCDQVTVLRDGSHVRTGPTAVETQESLVEAMLGMATDVAFPPPPPLPKIAARPVVEVRGVGSNTGLRRIDVVIRPGEIVGLAGLVGSGRTELARLIFGLDDLTAGEIVIGGRRQTRRSARRSMAQGVALIPEDRKKQGLIMTQDLQANIGLPVAGRGRRLPWMSTGAERKLARMLIRRLDIRPADPRKNVLTLSGGNQQKVLFAKWMTIKPAVVLLDEPTRGVDVGARLQIYHLIRELAEGGAAVLLISSELEEVFGLSHRIYLLKDGEKVGEVDPAAATLDDVLFTLFGVTRTRIGQESTESR